MPNHRRPSSIKKDIRAQRYYGIILFLLGIGYLAIVVTIGRGRLHGWWILLPVIAGLILLALARGRFRQARARWHGISREHQAIAQAEPLLKRRGFEVTPNVAVRRLGDIDMMLRRAGESVPVEIKAYRLWDSSPNRRSNALAQIERTKNHLDVTLAILWLPDVKAGLWRRVFGSRVGSVRIVYGSARNLARIASWHAS